MSAKKLLFLLGFFLFLFLPLSFSENPVKAVVIKNLDYTTDSESYFINVTTFAFSGEYLVDPNNPQDPIFGSSYKVASESLKDAEIYIEAEHFGASEPILISKIITSKQGEIKISAPTLEDPSAKTTKQIYYGEATGQWPDNLKNKCFLLKLRFENYPLDSKKLYKKTELNLGTACSGKEGMESVLLVGLRDSLFNPNNSMLCFPAIILFGLLVAGLYSRGMTLFGIMDLITPKAPSLPAFKYTYASFSPFGQLGTETARAIRHYEAYVLPAAMRKFNRDHNLNSEQHKQYGNLSMPKKMISSLVKTYIEDPNTAQQFINAISAKNVSDADAHIMTRALLESRLNSDDRAMLDLISNYLAYKEHSEAVGGRKPLSRPMKLLANMLMPLASGPAAWRNLLVSVRHGVVDTLYGVNSSIRTTWYAHLKLLDFLSFGKTQEPMKHMRVKFVKMRDEHEKKITSRLSNFDIYKSGKYYEGGTGWFHKYQWETTTEWFKNAPESLKEWTIARTAGAGLLLTGEPEAHMGEFAGNRIESTGSIYYMNLLQSVSTEAMAQYLRSLIKQAGIDEALLKNPIGSKKEIGSENINDNILKLSEIHETLSKLDNNPEITDKLVKVKEIAHAINEEIERAKIMTVVNDVQKRSNENVGILSNVTREVYERILNFLNSESAVFANAGHIDYCEATKKMTESLRNNAIASDPNHNSSIEKFTGAFHDIVNIMKEYREEKKTDFFFLKSTQKGFELKREKGQDIENTKDSFFVGFWLSAVDKMGSGLYKNNNNISMSELFSIYSLEVLNERTGLIARPDIIKEVSPMMFAGLDKSNGEEIKKGLMDSSVLGAAHIVSLLKDSTNTGTGISVVINKDGTKAELVNFARVNEILKEFAPRNTKTISTKDDFVRLILHPEEFGISNNKAFEFRMKLTESDKTKKTDISPAFNTELAYTTLNKEKEFASQVNFWKNEGRKNADEILNLKFSDVFNHRWKIITNKFTDENFSETSRKIKKVPGTMIPRLSDPIFDSLVVLDLAKTDSITLPRGKFKEFVNKEEKIITNLVDLVNAETIINEFMNSLFGKGNGPKISINSRQEFSEFFVSPAKFMKNRYGIEIDPTAPEMRTAISKLRNDLFIKCINEDLRNNATRILEKGQKTYEVNFGSKDITEEKVKSLEKFYDNNFLRDLEIGITATSRFFTRDDYTSVLRQTAFWKFMEARYGGEFEKPYEYLSKYTYDADMGLLNALGKGMMIDSAEKYHSLASIYQMVKTYGLKYMGVDIFDKDAVAENINKYTFSEVMEAMKQAKLKEGIKEEDVFRLTPSELKDSAWFLSKELGYIPFIPYANPDEALLPQNVKNLLRKEEEKFALGLCTKDDMLRAKQKIIDSYSHEVQISPYHMMISTSFYPVNINFYIVKNGRLKKIVLESLSESSSDLMGLVMKYGKELTPLFSESLSEIIINGIKSKNLEKWEFLRTSMEETGSVESKRRIHVTEEKLKAVAEEMFGKNAKPSYFECIKKISIDEYKQFFNEMATKAKYSDEIQFKAEKTLRKLQESSATIDSLNFSDISLIIKNYDEKGRNASVLGSRIIAEILYENPKGFNSNDPNNLNVNVLRKFLECYNIPELLTTITRTYGRFREYNDKEPIKKILKFLESKGEYYSAAGLAFELAENSGDQSFFLNVKGLYFGSNKEIRRRLYERSSIEISKGMQKLSFVERLSNLIISYSYMKVGMPTQFGLGETLSSLLWSTFHKELNAEERIFHASEMAKATDFRMCTYNKEYLRKLDREMMRYDGNPIKYIKRMIGTDPIDIRMQYISGALNESGAITREMGINYGAIDSTKRDGRIGAMFHLRSTLGASEMYSTAYVLGMSTPIMRNFSPFSSTLGMGMLLASPLAFLGTGPFIGGMIGAAFLSGTLPRALGRSIYKTSVAKEEKWKEKLERHISGEAVLSNDELAKVKQKLKKYKLSIKDDEKWTRRFAMASMRTDMGQLATRFASGFFNTTYGGPIRALATFQRHYIFPPPSDLIPQAPISSGGKYIYTPKKAWPTTLPRPGQAIKSAYTYSMLYGMPITMFLGTTLANPFGLGAIAGVIASAGWFGLSKFSQGVFAKRNNELRGHTGGFMDKSRMSITQRIARKISTVEGYEFGTPDEIQWRKAPGTFDFRWYTHEIADVGATTWSCPGQSYTDFYTGYYKTEPWIQHYAARNANSKGAFSAMPLSEVGRTYDLFSRYNATPVNKAMQSWKDIIGYEPSESAMWFVFSPYMLSLWLKRRMEEVVPVHQYYKNHSMIYGSDKESSEGMKKSFRSQGIKMAMYGMSLPLLTTVGPAALLLGSPMVLGGMKVASELDTSSSFPYIKIKTINNYLKRRKIAKEAGEKTRISGAYAPFTDSTFGQRCPACGSLKSRGGKCRSCGWDPIGPAF